MQRSTRPFRHALPLAAATYYAIYIARQAFTVGGRLHFVLFDDAMISMRYAMNLAHGHGLRWNPGEAPVEGYTNLLWTLVMAAVHLLPLGRPLTSLAVMLVGACVLVANVAVVSALADRVSGGSGVARAVAATLTAFSAPLAYWTLTGMEVGVLALMINGAAVLAIDHAAAPRWRRAALGVLLAAMTLVRIDAAVAVGCVLVGLWVYGDATVRRRDVPLMALAVVATLVLQTLGRWIYYGDLLPNTYYLKATGVGLSTRLARGARYLFWTTWVHSGALTVVALWSLINPNRAPLRLASVLCALIVSMQAAYSLYVGGDAWEYLGFANRYLTVALGPLLALVGAAVASAGEGDDRHRLAAALRIALGAGAASWVARAVQTQRWPQLTGVAAGSLSQREIVATSLFVALAMMLMIWGRAGALARGAFSPRRSPGALSAAWIALLMLSTDGWFHGQWVALNASGTVPQQENVRLGLLVERATRPGARVADFGAGATPYFCDRPFLDLLGKSDRHIARLPPAGPFLPGHNKWDYAYSIGEQRPDVVNRVFNAEHYGAAIPWARWGYASLPNGIHYRRDSRLVDATALAGPWRLRAAP